MVHRVTREESAVTTRALRYIGAIRNKAKSRYAFRYWQYLREPIIGAPDRGDLSLMAAQAVEMRLSEILKGAG